MLSFDEIRHTYNKSSGEVFGGKGASAFSFVWSGWSGSMVFSTFSYFSANRRYTFESQMMKRHYTEWRTARGGDEGSGSGVLREWE